MVRSTLFFAAVCLPALLGGCASGSVSPSGGMDALGPALSVERFLQAANTRDLEAMAGLFGTARGAIGERPGSTFGCVFRRVGSWIGLGQRCISRQDVELRMNAIAMILRHDDYQIGSERRVPGRARPTTRVGVHLERGDNSYPDVPFVVVRGSEGRWFIEEIGLERITGSRR